MLTYLHNALTLAQSLSAASSPLLRIEGLAVTPAHMGGLAAGVLVLLHVVPRFASTTGRREGKREGIGERGSLNAGLPAVTLKPTTAQHVATQSYQATRWHTRALDGPGLLSMCVGPAGAGKSEVVLGALRASYDGADFCGLDTTKPKRVLLLSEMGGETLAPALQRWHFYTTPAGRWQRLRFALPLLRPWGPGGLVDVVYSTDIYKPVVVDGELRQADWPAVIEAIRPLVERGRYDRVIVDSLGEWLGSDNNDAMLKTLAACRQLTAAGAGVTLLHHTPRSDPRRPRGGSVIEAKLDVGYSITGLGSGGMPRSRQDPARQIEWFKTRFPDLTPPGALVMHREWFPGSGERPCYRLGSEPRVRDVSPATTVLATVQKALPPPAATISVQPSTSPLASLTGRQRDILTALQASPEQSATTPELAAAVGIPGVRAAEALRALVAKGLVLPAGTGTANRKGSKLPRRWAAATTSTSDAAERLLREALGAESQGDTYDASA